MFIRSLRCGGAERIASILATGLEERGHDVSFLLWGGEDSFYGLPDSITVTALGLDAPTSHIGQSLLLNVRRMQAVGAALRLQKPDLLISHMTHGNCLALMATRILNLHRCPVIVSEHNNPARQGHPAIWRFARRALYPQAAAVVPCGSGVGGWFESRLPEARIVPIPNPVVIEDRDEDPAAEAQARKLADARWVLAMGRLVPQKGLEMLLRSFAEAVEKVKEQWHLGIIGEGPLREQIQEQIRALGLGESVHFLGTFANPLPVLRAGDIFALSSRYEGFPVSLLEAMACGLPAVAFDCDHGPREIIRDGKDGLLVPAGEEKAFARSLTRLMRNQRMRERFSRAGASALRRWNRSAYLDRWQHLIGSVTPRCPVPAPGGTTPAMEQA
jgi:glycosyltransferase involved in cell wall biosynthesis